MKIVTKEELQSILAELKEGATVATSGAGGGLMEPDDALSCFEAAFLAQGTPRNLTLVHALGLGDRARRGVNRFAHEGMVRRVIGGHWVWSPTMLRMAQENKIEAYCLPGGAIMHLFREIGAGRPGLFTHVGLGTFVDPRQQGGRCNAISTEDIVELMHIDGKDVLRYKPFPVDVGVIRGTYVDEAGNISASEEPADLDAYSLALAARNSGGIVVAQVRERVANGHIRPREVTVPGNLVDYVIVCPDQQQTYQGGYHLSLAGLEHGDVVRSSGKDDAARRIVAARAADELIPGTTLNFGFGMSADVAEIIFRTGRQKDFWFTIEQGIHGGDLLTGDMFGIAANPMGIVSSPEQFDLYSGGGLDMTFLGLAEMDGTGNVNVSHFAGQISGPGGFIDITQKAKAVVFCGSFDTKGARSRVADGRLVIDRHGEVRKLVDRVAGITFSGEQAIAEGKKVVYVTERAVFRLTPEGVELTEVAPGIDIRADILDRMGFMPIIREPKTMSARFFDTAAPVDSAA
ncbi:acyl CoA:acetate/3-ketoacid CoA transferase [Ancylobacter mangrovi]|uniref:acyl CoA:acetate/3-ketoacid CoA transferase n=1 Tax=Ancylobacter mangrovi TaxID=2972472 RepID=UPI002163905D|nr:CoA-transferase [Ancylobacter mangrovi]MCS0503356.1 acyl CoA:acetate/3-ketoacid CoA transferase [Ancylobacter mangrovi]